MEEKENNKENEKDNNKENEKDNNNKENEKEKENKEYFEMKQNSSELIVNDKDGKSDNFVILSKEKEFSDDFGFSDLSFKIIYKDDPLLEHVISHISDYLEKYSENTEKKCIETLTNFINYDEFSENIINEILLNGIPESLPCIRPLIWKSLIGLYPLKKLEKWKNETINRNKNYKKMIEKYNYYPNDVKNEKEINLINQINKDLPRTRFDVKIFHDKNKNNEKEINYDVLRRILFFYANEHETLYYVQGMNEIIAIIFYIFSKDDNPFIQEYIESDAYYTFEILLEEIKDVFLMENINYSDLFVTSQIKEIKSIMKKVDSELFNHFEEVDLQLDNLVMRWILVLFAQEFVIDVAVNFWDRLFTQENKMKFICYISVAIIKMNRENILKMDAGEIMYWGQQLQNNMNELDINNIIKIALDIKHRYNRRESKHIPIK